MTTTILASDLDGTLIPIDGNPAHTDALSILHNAIENTHAFDLFFVTGRHFDSAKQAITEHSLPPPKKIICDVGTSIFDKQPSGWVANIDYQKHLAELNHGLTENEVEKLFSSIDYISLQEPPHQGTFKTSYYCPNDSLEAALADVHEVIRREGIAFMVLSSIDPFKHCGMIDILPVGVSKAYALQWLVKHDQILAQQIVFFGDSGNDIHVFKSDIKSVVVANTPDNIKQELQNECAVKCQRKDLYFAHQESTSGVLEGCRHFGAL